MSSIRAASRVVLTTYDEDIVRKAVEECRESLDGTVPTVAFCFVSADWQPHIRDLVEVVQVHGHCPMVAGSGGYGLIGTGEENENVSGFSVLMLSLPGAEVRCVSLDAEDFESPRGVDEWQRETGVGPDAGGDWILLGNPSVMNAESWLKTWNSTYPDAKCFGGLASGGGSEELFVFSTGDSTVGDAAAIALHFGGAVRLEGVVSQGCRPIGEPYTITSVDDNFVLEIASKRAFDVLEEAFDSLREDERAVAKGNIFAGLAMSEYREEFGAGDFLVRNIIGGDPDAGVIALGAYPRVGQTLQFQLRDKDTADEDMRQACRENQEEHGQPFAVLLFTCAGRGVHMFGAPNHDAGVIEEVFGKVPLAGFFCGGEIGPVGGQNFLHGYTASAVMFR